MSFDIFHEIPIAEVIKEKNYLKDELPKVQNNLRMFQFSQMLYGRPPIYLPTNIHSIAEFTRIAIRLLDKETRHSQCRLSGNNQLEKMRNGLKEFGFCDEYVNGVG